MQTLAGQSEYSPKQGMRSGSGAMVGSGPSGHALAYRGSYRRGAQAPSSWAGNQEGEKAMASVLVDPTSSAAQARFTLAPRRFRDLDGKTVGLLNSTKFNSDHLLDGIGELLQERYAVRELVRERKPYFGRPIPEEQARELAARCDVLITAIGD